MATTTIEAGGEKRDDGRVQTTRKPTEEREEEEERGKKEERLREEDEERAGKWSERRLRIPRPSIPGENRVWGEAMETRRRSEIPESEARFPPRVLVHFD